MLNEALLDYYARTAEAAPETSLAILGLVGGIVVGLGLAIGVLISIISIAIAADDGESVKERVFGTIAAVVIGAGFLAGSAHLYFHASAEEERVFGNRNEVVVQALESDYGVTLAEENVGKLLDTTCEHTEEGCEPVVATLADGSKKMVRLLKETQESWVVAVEGSILQPLSSGD